MLSFASTRTPFVFSTARPAVVSERERVLAPAAHEAAAACADAVSGARTVQPQVPLRVQQRFVRMGLQAERLNHALAMWPAAVLLPQVPLAQQLGVHARTPMERCKFRLLARSWHPLRHVLGSTVNGRTLRSIGRQLSTHHPGPLHSSHAGLQLLLHGLLSLLPDALDKKRLQKIFMQGLFLTEEANFGRNLAAITCETSLNYAAAKQMLDDYAGEWTPLVLLALAQIDCSENTGDRMSVAQEIEVLQDAIVELEAYYAQQIAFLNSTGSVSSSLSEQEKMRKLEEFSRLDLPCFNHLKQRLMGRLCLLKNMQSLGPEPAQLMALCRGVRVDRRLTLPAESAIHPNYLEVVARVIRAASAQAESGAARAA
jgi:hypothetical protein